MTPRDALDLAAPHTWAASVLPAVFGIVWSVLNGGRLTAGMAAILFLICVMMQSAVNTVNDYMDYVKGTDSKEDNLEENDAVLLYRNIVPGHALALAAGLLACALALGLWIVSRSGTAPLIVGLVGGAAVVAYSAGPFPLSYLPVGELVSGVVMGGLIPTGIFAAAKGRIEPAVLFWSLPMIISVGLIMMSNNGCDIEKDRAAGRRTLPALLGRERTKKLYTAAVLLWTACAAVLPVLRFGATGLAAVILLLTAGRKAIAQQLHCPLDQEHRVQQMKGILKANVVLDGIYIVSLLIGACIHGI